MNDKSLHKLNSNTLGQVRREIRHFLSACGRMEDSDYLLCHSLNCSLTWLYSHPEHQLQPYQKNNIEHSLTPCLAGVPLSQLKSQKEFYSLDFKVTPDVLTPRPETEHLVEQALQFEQAKLRILDLGTGCGNIAIAIQAHRPNWHITATDVSQAALDVAQYNAKQHGATHITFRQSDWFCDIDTQFDLIISNPPYISKDDPDIEPQVVKYEPALALFAPDNGLAAMKHIIEQASEYLNTNGWIILEHGYCQSDAVCQMLCDAHFSAITCLQDHSGHLRAVAATFAST